MESGALIPLSIFYIPSFGTINPIWTMKFPMDILPASFLDLGALNKLERACFDKDAWPFLDLLAVLTYSDVIRLKAVDDGQMIGFVAGDPHPSQGFSWIATIGVLPEYQRKGIGRQLLRACEAQLKTPRVRLSVRASNAGAIRLYEQEGYHRADVWQAYYNDGEAALIMEKEREI
ncbi:MAG: GNAT family N-acetyltransferase [Chloroflexi bacterium]|nr:GNAT family N-acetyltransferase [Chloroflexota bacterium]MBI3341083.1 GNAT family N-acetyltransferase [Chloroflexota bacterium]